MAGPNFICVGCRPHLHICAKFDRGIKLALAKPNLRLKQSFGTECIFAPPQNLHRPSHRAVDLHQHASIGVCICQHDGYAVVLGHYAEAITNYQRNGQRGPVQFL